MTRWLDDRNAWNRGQLFLSSGVNWSTRKCKDFSPLYLSQECDKCDLLYQNFLESQMKHHLNTKKIHQPNQLTWLFNRCERDFDRQTNMHKMNFRRPGYTVDYQTHLCPLAKFSCVKRAWESRDVLVLSLHIQSGPRNLTFEKKEEKMNFHLPPYKRYLFAKLLTFFVLYPSTLLNYHSYIYYENTYQYN